MPENTQPAPLEEFPGQTIKVLVILGEIGGGEDFRNTPETER